MTQCHAVQRDAGRAAPQERPPAIAVRGLAFVRARHAVLDVPALDIEHHEVLAVIGPNGAGKTTLLLCLALLMTPTAGTIAYNGVNIRQGRDALRQRRRMGVVFQDPLLLNASVGENVALGLRFRGAGRQGVDHQVREWLERFGIAHLARRHAHELSGGEAQRVSLARAFVVQPDVLFLDEPFTNLDGPTHRALVDSLASVLEETGVTTVFVSHDLKDVVRLADRVAVVIGGVIRQLGRPRDVVTYPLGKDVEAFIAAHRTGGGLGVAP